MAAKAPPSTIAQVKDVFTKLGEISDKVVFGDVWERKQLSKRDRSLITVAALTALYRPDQLRGHLHRAFDNGVTKEEIIEVITHLSFYAGWPNGGTRGADREGSIQGTRRMKIGFIGLGAMGRPMAASLQRAGHALQVLRPAANRRPSQLEDLRHRSRQGLRAPVHLAAGPGGSGGRGAAGPLGEGVVRPQHQLPDGRPTLHPKLQSKGVQLPRRAGQRRAERRAERQARHLGRRRRRRFSKNMNPY